MATLSHGLRNRAAFRHKGSLGPPNPIFCAHVVHHRTRLPVLGDSRHKTAGLKKLLQTPFPRPENATGARCCAGGEPSTPACALEQCVQKPPFGIFQARVQRLEPLFTLRQNLLSPCLAAHSSQKACLPCLERGQDTKAANKFLHGMSCRLVCAR